jgi:hypothetical protein
LKRGEWSVVGGDLEIVGNRLIVVIGIFVKGRLVEVFFGATKEELYRLN